MFLCFFGIFVCSLKWFFSVCACFVYLGCVHLSTPATCGREGNGLRAGHESRKCPETSFPCEIRWATTGTEAHSCLKHGNIVKQSKACSLPPWFQTISFPFLEEWKQLSRECWKFISKNEHLWHLTEMDVLRCEVGGKTGIKCQY